MPRLPTAEEQLYLELANRARADPEGEFDALIADAARREGVTPGITSALDFFDVDLALFKTQLAGLAPAAPLAWSGALARSATTHSQGMIDFDLQTHNLPGEPSLLARIAAEGYGSIRALAENVFAYAADPVTGHGGFYIDWGYGPGGIQSPAGHRVSILNPLYTDLGIGVLAETDPLTRIGPQVVTQHFGASWQPVHHLLGVVLDDADGDAFYDLGEGVAGVTVSARNGTETVATTSWASGGYQLALDDGTWEVTFTGGGLAQPYSTVVVMDGANVKTDLTVQEVAALAAADPTPLPDPGRSVAGTVGPERIEGGTGADTLAGHHGADTLLGGAGNDRLAGNAGPDLLDGGTGADTLEGGIGADRLLGGGGRDLLAGQDGADTLAGGDGADTLTGNAGPDHLEGGAGNDWLEGGINHDALAGGAGHDRLWGGTGADTLWGGDGNDTLRGNAGADLLAGGAGDDLISGGIGADVFRFARGGGMDTIVDFQPGIDRLDLDPALASDPVALAAATRPDPAGLRLDFGGGDGLLLLGLTDPVELGLDGAFA